MSTRQRGKFYLPVRYNRIPRFFLDFYIYFQDENAKTLSDLVAKFEASEPTEGMKLITSRSLTPAGDSTKVFNTHTVGILNDANLIIQSRIIFRLFANIFDHLNSTGEHN